MSDTKLIEELCHVVDMFCKIVRRLAIKLEMINALDAEDKIAIDAAFGKYSETLGSEEIPDCFCDSDHSCDSKPL